MIKSKALKKYYGRKAYADGYYGRVREYAIIEDIDGFRQEWSLFTCTDRVLRFEKVVIIDKLNFLTKNNVVIAIAVVDGRTFVGSAVLNPNDKNNNKVLGRRLALARAMQDPDGEENILYEVSLHALEEVEKDDKEEEEEIEPDGDKETEETEETEKHFF